MIKKQSSIYRHCLLALILPFCQANTINQQNQFISNKNLLRSASTPMPTDSHDYPFGRLLELQEGSNIVTEDLSTRYKPKACEYFDYNHYNQRQYSENANDNPLSSEIENNLNLASIIGSDNRTKVNDPKSSLYLPTAFILITYNNVYNQKTKSYDTRKFIGSAFLEGWNLAVTAGHCVYGDVTDSGDYEDNTDNPRFASKIEFFFGAESYADIQKGSAYQYYAVAEEVSIESAYYIEPKFPQDWAAVKLDRNIGNKTWWYGKIENWYQDNASIYTCGYPGDKPEGTMWEVSGKLVKKESDFLYNFDLDVMGGQSGSPLFKGSNNKSGYVCGIATFGSPEHNGGTIFSDLVYSFLNSFVTSDTSRDYAYEYLSLSSLGNSEHTWSIRVTNNTSKIIRCHYNKKMCFNNDAAAWNLSNVDDIIIRPYGYQDIQISENWFATSVAVCYEYMNKKVITYADNLSNNGLREYHNLKELKKGA